MNPSVSACPSLHENSRKVAQALGVYFFCRTDKPQMHMFPLKVSCTTPYIPSMLSFHYLLEFPLVKKVPARVSAHCSGPVELLRRNFGLREALHSLGHHKVRTGTAHILYIWEKVCIFKAKFEQRRMVN